MIATEQPELTFFCLGKSIKHREAKNEEGNESFHNGRSMTPHTLDEMRGTEKDELKVRYNIANTSSADFPRSLRARILRASLRLARRFPEASRMSRWWW